MTLVPEARPTVRPLRAGGDAPEAAVPVRAQDVTPQWQRRGDRPDLVPTPLSDPLVAEVAPYARDVRSRPLKTTISTPPPARHR